jgi:hypothetical protein
MARFLQNPRRQPRVPLRLPVEVLHGRESWRAETNDLGPGGCLVLSPRPLIERSQVRVVLRCENLAEALDVCGNVAWARGDRGGIAFAARQLTLLRRPETWFKRLLEARPGLAGAMVRAPDRLRLDTPLYFLPAPRHIQDFTPDEMKLLCGAENGITVEALLSSSAMDEGRAARALFSLFEKSVLTLSMGQASDAWKWRAALRGSVLPCDAQQPPSHPPRAPLLRVAPPTSAAPRAPVLSPCARRSPPIANEPPLLRQHPTVPTAGTTGGGRDLLRGVGATRRPPEAHARLEEARAAAQASRIDVAVMLLRQALVLAPRDAEISKLLGELAFKNRTFS